MDCACGNRMLNHDDLTFECRACHRVIYGPDIVTGNPFTHEMFVLREKKYIRSGAMVCENCHRVMLGSNGVRVCLFCHTNVKTEGHHYMLHPAKEELGRVAYGLVMLSLIAASFAFRMVS